MNNMAHRPHRTALSYLVTLIVMVIFGTAGLLSMPEATPGNLNAVFFGAFIPAVFAGLLTYVLR